MDNYIVINGKKAELTEEQLKALGIEDGLERNNPFGKITDNSYYYITSTDRINFTENIDSVVDEDLYNNTNYFNDEDFTNQVMLHQKLYRKLLKYAYDNYVVNDCSEWDCENLHYHIIFSNRIDKFFVGYDDSNKYSNIVYFSKMGVAEQAIEDVIKPFMIEHHEFVW